MREIIKKCIEKACNRKDLEQILKKLGFKHNQFFSDDELVKRASIFYQIASQKDLNFINCEWVESETEFIDCVTQLLNDCPEISPVYYRFASKKELKLLKGQ